MKIRIQNLRDMQISGVHCCFHEECQPYLEGYFDWTAYPMITDMGDANICAGFLRAWRHTPNFRQVETHSGKELFYFVEGSCVMLFCDVRDGQAVMENAQLARIDAGTELVIDAGKAHFVPVGITDSFTAVVVSPKQEAPRIDLPEEIIGI